jgi:uncharacterized membrane protein YadS
VVTEHSDSPRAPAETPAAASLRSRWTDLYLKEDWWAIWLGVGLTLAAIAVMGGGGAGILKAAAVNAGGIDWSGPADIGAHFAARAGDYLISFLFWYLVLGLSLRVMGISLRRFTPAFVLLYVLATAMFVVSGWEHADQYNLEASLAALLVGLLISNVGRLPDWLDDGFRVEYYVKTGIVLLGATFPLTLVVTAGPIAIFQATVIAVITCLTIFFVGTRLFGLDKRLCAVLGVGGSVCGVSGSIAIASAVRAKKDDVVTSVSLVVVWAIVMVFALPLVSRMLGLSAGVGGAWVGSSEFADAAGFAAASAYGSLAGNEEQAVQAFTLMKVIGRDIWIGIWAFAFALIATVRWERAETGARPDAREIWWRFPKFVIGFFIASLIVTLVVALSSATAYTEMIKPQVLDVMKGLRGWAFVFCFLSIGLTTRFRELRGVNWRSFGAFTSGVVLNVSLGLVLSAVVFNDFWSSL